MLKPIAIALLFSKAMLLNTVVVKTAETSEHSPHIHGVWLNSTTQGLAKLYVMNNKLELK